MAMRLDETLLSLLNDPATAAAQADLAQAVTLSRQALLLRQRAGAAAAQVRRAKEWGADEGEVAALEDKAKGRLSRLETAEAQAAAADFRRPFPQEGRAQVFGRATGQVETPPLTAALLTAQGEVAARAAALATGAFHLTAEGTLLGVRVQLSDAAGRILWRSPGSVDVPAGTVLYIDAALGAPEPEPGPVPAAPQMPDLVGQSEGVARAILGRLGIAEVAIEDSVAEGQPGIVIAQKPRAGAALGDKPKVSLTVRRARGDAPEPHFLPGLVGRPLAEAEAVLKSLGLRGTVRRQPDAGPADIVLAQEPGEGTRLDDLRSVELTVSRAMDAPPETVVVPEVTGKPGDLALELLKAAGLAAEVSDSADPAAGPGVVAQDPKAGSTLPRGATVKITVNTPPDPDPGVVLLPQVVGRPAAEARKLLTELGLKTALETADDVAAKGTVLRQTPEADTTVAPGSTVTLVQSSGRAAEAPDLSALIARMAEDPRAKEADLGADRLEALFKTADVTTLDEAKVLAEGTAKDIATRTGLTEPAQASTFRTALRAALKALG